MGKFSKEAYICLISGFWSVIVILCSLFDVLDIRHNQDFYKLFCKIATAMLGVSQFMISAKLLAFSKYVQNTNNNVNQSWASWARTYYYSYLMTAVLMTSIFVFYYVFKERHYSKLAWGISYYDMILFLNIAVYVAFVILHTPPKMSATNKPNGRMNVDWIAREIVPERIVAGFGSDIHKNQKQQEAMGDGMKIHSTNSNLPYSRMENDSFA